MRCVTLTTTIWGQVVVQNLNGSRYLTTPLWGMACHLLAWTCYCQPNLKSPPPPSTRWDAKCRNWGGLWQSGVTQGHWTRHHFIDSLIVPSTVTASIFHHYLPTGIWHPYWGWPLSNFPQIFGILGLLCGTVCMILCLAILIQYQLVTYGLAIANTLIASNIKSRVTRCWHGYLCGANCKWFAYGPADATATPSSLASLKSRMSYPSSTGLCRLSWKRGR